ncbi:hypothetical protein DXG01_012027, partial [Tephrocybe rancida]
MAPEDKKFLYALFLGIDANFRLKRKNVSSDQRDPSLGGGWAFFVEESAYKAHVASNWKNTQPRSTCVSHDAVNKPDKEARGLAASGAGTVDCARHDMKRPNGVGDLQLGERYMNMDYITLSSLRDTEVEIVVCSYDIVCQWSVNFRERMISYPNELHLSSSIKFITFLIPKFHLPAHIEACNTLYSFNLAVGVGRTDGEAPERGWANINPIAQSTKEMGPGARHDTIDDHFNDWNWRKTVQFGPRMIKKLRETASSAQLHLSGLEEFEDAVPKDVIDGWRVEVMKWERDPALPNPYQLTTKAISERVVRLELAKDIAAKEAVQGVNTTSHEMHASVMIANGLVIEED